LSVILMEQQWIKARTWLEIDRTALLHNHKQIGELLPEGVDMMAVVKADAYGHGAAAVAELLSDRVSYFGVASAYEAIELRRSGIENEILILGGTDASLYAELLEYGIIPTLFDVEAAEQYVLAAGDREAPCFLAVDTGMSRIGFSDDEAGAEAIASLAALPGLRIVGIFSHFARADEQDKTSALAQIERFRRFLALLDAKKVTYGLRSLCNSAGLMELDAAYDLVRAGIILYGLYPSSEVERERLDLHPVLSFRTRVELVKTVPAGTGVSYGHIAVTERETRLATLCAGYADGVPRLLSGVGCVLLHGKRAPIVGRICMDQMMVDVTDIPEVQVGDVATLIGSDGEAMITADEVAEQAGTISYEILCSLSRPRLPRLYLP